MYLFDFSGYIYCISEWTAVQRGVKIPWHLEQVPLQIKTDSVVGSNDWIWMVMYNKDNSSIGGTGVKFSTPNMYYQINQCTSSNTDLPVQPPEKEEEKVWTFIKTETAIIITCNNVEMLNYVLSDSSDSRCVTQWGGDVVQQIMFHSIDKASDFYRAGKAYYGS